MIYVPHDYQQFSTNFILSHPIAAVLLQMGLGKSVITLTAIRTLLDRGEISRVLVIAPACGKVHSENILVCLYKLLVYLCLSQRRGCRRCRCRR